MGKRPRYDKLANDYAKWIFAYIDRYDWGYFHPDEGHPIYAATNDRLNQSRAGIAYPPSKITRTHIQSHLRGTGKLYYTSGRSSGFAFPMIDIDAHRGEPDALATADYLVKTCFPGAYFEASKRGYHLHPLIRVGRITRRRFNDLLKELEQSLGTLARSEGFASTVEVKGDFTLITEEKEIEKRGSLATIPFLRGGHPDLDGLQRAPIFLPAAIYEINRRAGEFQANESELEESNKPSPDVYVSSGSLLPRRDSNCAWERMQWACFDFTVIYRRLPDVEELLEYYQRLHDTDDGTKARRSRAEAAIRYRAKTFDPAKATEGGYEFHRERLFQAVKTYCIDRTHKCETAITDEDLAIGLYVVMRNSFAIQDDPKRQWTCPNACFTGMFDALKKASLTKRGARKQNKVVAIKEILERAKLIDCVDRKWVNRGRVPVGKKYHIGTNHWRFAEFVRVSQEIKVEYVGHTKVNHTSESSRRVFSEPALI